MATIRADKVVEGTASGGVEVDGLSIKDGIPRNNITWRLRNTTTQSITTSTYVRMALNSTDWDTGSIADLSNNQVTVTQTGKYWVNAQTTFNSQNYITSYMFRVNGTATAAGFIYQLVSGQPLKNFATILDLTAGDDVYVELYSYAGSTRTIGSTSIQNLQSIFEGYFIGE